MATDHSGGDLAHGMADIEPGLRLHYVTAGEGDGKLTIPVLAVGGATSTSGPLVEEMAREVAGDVTGLRIPGAAHWIAEENPEAFNAGLLTFLARSDAR
jgi:pimeloyl-ACP methyl ester carboxylesterase